MKKERAEALLSGMLEILAAIEHERWSEWQHYIHKNGKRQADGSLLLPAELVDRWERQIATPYPALTEKEKDSDRDQVRRYLHLIVEGLTEMSAIQVSAELKQTIYEMHRLWLTELPRQVGQIGSTIGALIEGPPIYASGEVTPYSDYPPVRFYSVDPAFVAFLKARNIPFQEN